MGKTNLTEADQEKREIINAKRRARYKEISTVIQAVTGSYIPTYKVPKRKKNRRTSPGGLLLPAGYAIVNGQATRIEEGGSSFDIQLSSSSNHVLSDATASVLHDTEENITLSDAERDDSYTIETTIQDLVTSCDEDSKHVIGTNDLNAMNSIEAITQLGEVFDASEIYDAAGTSDLDSNLLMDYAPSVTASIPNSSTLTPGQPETEDQSQHQSPAITSRLTLPRAIKKPPDSLRACHQFSQRYNLNDACTMDLIRLLEKIRLQEIQIKPDELPRCLKAYHNQIGGVDAITTQIHWKCSKCSRAHKTAFKNRLVSIECCGSRAKHTDSHFFTLSLRDILARSLSRIFSTIKQYEFQYEGLQRIKKKVSATEDDIFISLNTDGVAVSKSSSKSLWPILASVLGTPQHLRKDHCNMFMQSLWVSIKETPDLNWLFTAVVYELMELEVDPIVWQDSTGKHHSTKVYLTYVCTDSMARFKVSGLQMHNGRYGCTFCTHEQPGHYFSHTETNPERSHEDYIAAYSRQSQNVLIEEQYLEPRSTVNVEVETFRDMEAMKYKLKHRSVLCDLHYFDIIWGLPIDSMHTVSHGVFKLLINSLLFPSDRIKANTKKSKTHKTSSNVNSQLKNTENVKEGRYGDIVWDDIAMTEFARVSASETLPEALQNDFSSPQSPSSTKTSTRLPLKKYDREKIDAFLKTIQPPQAFARYPRQLNERAHFKAHEWAALGVIYLPLIFKELLPPSIFNLYLQLLRGIEILSKHGRSEQEITEAAIVLNAFSAGISKHFVDGAVNYNIHLLKHLPRCYTLYGPLYLYSLRYYENFNKKIVGYTCFNQFTAVHAVKRYANSVVDPPDPTFLATTNRNVKVVSISGTTLTFSNPVLTKGIQPADGICYGKVSFKVDNRTLVVTALSKDPLSVRHNSSCFITSAGTAVEVTKIQLHETDGRIDLFCNKFQLKLWQPPLEYIWEVTAEEPAMIIPIQTLQRQCVRINHNKKCYFLVPFNSIDLNME